MALTIDELNIQITAECTKATGALDKLIEKLGAVEGKLNVLDIANTKASNGLNQTTNSTNKATTATNKYSNATNKAVKSSKSFTDGLAQKITKFRTLFGAFKTAANMMASWFNESNDYIETLNLFNVTMGDGADAAYKYAESVQKLIGIDIAEWMQYQGVFKNLASGFGVSSKAANIMSQNLTQLSYDMASFFNPTEGVVEAFDKLSSAMSGQVKGLREYGIDTTVASLQQYALSKGIETSVRSMTQAEKSMLRYNYIMEKSRDLGIWNDMARTINTPANALRILSAQFTQLKRALGNIISVIATKFIPYVQAMVQVITEAATAIAKFFGFSEKDFAPDTSSFGELGAMVEDSEDGLDGVSDKVKEIKKQLMGFDELNIISNPDTDSGASGSGGSAGGALGNMELLEYDFLKGLETGKLDEIKKKLKDILGYIPLIAGALTGLKLGKFLANLITAGAEAKGLKESLLLIGKKFTATVGITLAVAGIVWEWSEIIESMKSGLDGESFLKILAAGGLTIGGAAMFGATIGYTLISAAVAAVIAGIPMYFVGIYDAIKNGLNWLNGLLIPLGVTLAGAGVGAIIGSLGGPIGAGVGALIGLAVGLITDYTIWLWQHFDGIEKWFMELPTFAQIGIGGIVPIALGALTLITGGAFLIPLAIAAVIAAIKTDCFGLIEWVREKIITPLSKAATWIYTTVIAPIMESIKKVFIYATEKYIEIKNGIIASVEPIISKVVEIYNKVKEIFVALWWAFKEYLWNPMAEKVSAWYTEHIKPVVDKVKAAFTEIWENFKAKVYDKIVAQVDKMKQRIETLGKGIVDVISGSFKLVMNELFWRIETFINTFIWGLNKAIGLINKIPGVQIETISNLSIPRLAEGGIVGEGQMFIAREAGPELVGSIGRKTAVANNDQIVSGIEAGVYRAMVAANSGNSGGSQTIRLINEIDGDVIGEKVIQYHNGRVMQTGASPLLV